MEAITKNTDEKSSELFYLYVAVLVLQIMFVVMQFIPIFDVNLAVENLSTGVIIASTTVEEGLSMRVLFDSFDFVAFPNESIKIENLVWYGFAAIVVCSLLPTLAFFIRKDPMERYKKNFGNIALVVYSWTLFIVLANKVDSVIQEAESLDVSFVLNVGGVIYIVVSVLLLILSFVLMQKSSEQQSYELMEKIIAKSKMPKETVEGQYI